jgi:hypothetical protein
MIFKITEESLYKPDTGLSDLARLSGLFVGNDCNVFGPT